MHGLGEQFEVNTVCVMGQGYIGLPTSAVLARAGVKVIGVDPKPDVVATINDGRIHIVEPDLEGLVNTVVRDGLLTATTKPQAADVFIITVPTPIDDSKAPDMSFVETAITQIAPLLAKGNLVIIESTSPVGTTAAMATLLAGLRTDLTFPHAAGEDSDIRMAYCPERVLPGQIITELVQNDRIVGGLTTRCAEAAAQLYYRFVRGECSLTTAATAEMVKLTENAYRDVNIAFANELSVIADELEVNVWDVIAFANRHPRVNILRPGPGVGGHCIAVDPWFIVHSAPKAAKLIKQARTTNDGKPARVIKSVHQALKKTKNVKVACLGLAFKPDVDDLRESPALHIVESLAADGVELLVAEPNITALPSSLTASNVRFTDALSAVQEADVVLVLVGHRPFSFINKAALDGKKILDTVGLWQR